MMIGCCRAVALSENKRGGREKGINLAGKGKGKDQES